MLRRPSSVSARLWASLVAVVFLAASCAAATDTAVDVSEGLEGLAGDEPAIELVEPAASAGGTEPEPSEAPVPTATATVEGDDQSDSDEGGQDGQNDQAASGPAAVLIPEVIETFPHDPDAFTQGFELIGDNVILESTGLRGQSSLRRVALASGEVLERVDVDDDLFAEGLTRVDDTLIQLTWTSGVSLWYNAETFELERTVEYDGEGWGLCFDGDRLVMSDGSDLLTFRDPDTFEALGTVAVTLDGQPVIRLNELECVNGSVWANIWQTSVIVEIDPASGVVENIIDASELVNQRSNDEGVLNGIAFDAANEDFLITGKNWNTVFRVRFVSAP